MKGLLVGGYAKYKEVGSDPRIVLTCDPRMDVRHRWSRGRAPRGGECVKAEIWTEWRRMRHGVTRAS